MESQVFNPVTLARLAGPNFSRVDVLRTYLDRRLFRGATFANIASRPGAPVVILNATDMAVGEVFSFRPSRFDDLCSDLSRFPLAGAVAASAAFPVLLTPVSLKNWSGPACKVNPMPVSVRVALTTGARYVNLAQYKAALQTVRMRGCAYPCADPASRVPSILYQHLLDGGLVDNLGTSAIVQELFSPVPGGELAAMNQGQIRNLVAIEVIARTSAPSPVSTQPSTPGVFSVIGSVIHNPIDSATRGNAEIFQTALEDLRQAGTLRNYAPARVGLPDRVYSVQVDPDQFDETKPDQAMLRQQFESIPTSWSMGGDDFAAILISAHRLLYAHPCFVRLLQDRAVLSAATLAAGAPLGDPGLCTADATPQAPVPPNIAAATVGRR